MSAQLLPCPFCGNAATSAYSKSKGWKIECEGRWGTCTINARTHYQPTKVQAEDAWNRRAPTAAGYKLIGPDDAKLIQTALEHASFALDGIVALDDEDMGKDGGSATAQHTKRTVDRALKALLALREKDDG